MQSKFYISVSGDFVIISVHGPRERRCNKNLHSPLAGIRSRSDSSACGNVIKILHPRKRRFYNYFGSRSPRAEIHINIYISPSREYDPESTVLLVEMQSKYCIPASGDFVIIHVHIGPTNGDARKSLHSPLREYDPEPAIPLAETQSKHCISASGYFVIILVPVDEMHYKLCIPASGNTKRTAHIRFADRMCAVPLAVLQEIRSFLIPEHMQHFKLLINVCSSYDF